MRMKEKEIREEILKLLKPLEVKLHHIGFVKEDGLNFLRIELDGNDLKKCEEVSKEISKYLDENPEKFPDEYFLDVCSAGVEKIIYDEKDLEEALEKYIHIDFKKSVLDLKKVEGFLKEIKDDVLKIEYKDKNLLKQIEVSKNNIKLIRHAIKI